MSITYVHSVRVRGTAWKLPPKPQCWTTSWVCLLAPLGDRTTISSSGFHGLLFRIYLASVQFILFLFGEFWDLGQTATVGFLFYLFVRVWCILRTWELPVKKIKTCLFILTLSSFLCVDEPLPDKATFTGQRRCCIPIGSPGALSKCYPHMHAHCFSVLSLKSNSLHGWGWPRTSASWGWVYRHRPANMLGFMQCQWLNSGLSGC